MLKRMVLLVIVLCLTLGVPLAQAAPDPCSTGPRPRQPSLSMVSRLSYWHMDTRLIIDPWLTGNPGKLPKLRILTYSTSWYRACAWRSHRRYGRHRQTDRRQSDFDLRNHPDACRGRSVTNVHPMSIGGKWNFEFGWVKVTNAIHGSGVAGAGRRLHHQFLRQGDLFCRRYGTVRRHGLYRQGKPGFCATADWRQLHYGAGGCNRSGRFAAPRRK